MSNWLLADLPPHLKAQAEQKLGIRTHKISDGPNPAKVSMPEKPAKAPEPKKVPRAKFGNKKTEVDGVVFHSRREAARYRVLKSMELAGEIRGLQCQTKYRLEVNGVLVCTYKADFTYEEQIIGTPAWRAVVEDVKGYPNDRWPMKKKLMKACHGVEIRET